VEKNSNFVQQNSKDKIKNTITVAQKLRGRGRGRG
jgi:hypothetical protein